MTDKKFHRPKLSTNIITNDIKNDFHKKFSEVTGSSKVKKIKENTQKVSLNMREGDINIIKDIRNKLLDMGMRDPMPTATDIHRMAILYLEKANDNVLQKLFEQVLR